MVSAALYQQGAGFHSAANMFKHAIETVLEEPKAAELYPILVDIKSWMRDTWEHIISHYMYAVGGIFISWINAYVFRNYVVSKVDRHAIIAWIVNSILYGLIIGSVAIEFPKGSIVALALIIGYGFVILGSHLYRKGDWQLSSFARRPVIQSYVVSYMVALIVVLGWTIKAKGLKNREEASKQ
ncbi:hypothetical protein BC831DRAFT_142705 [Entophlyctis helioformis]|nr:hypothetical protein BC831DRAFT_142705 [Entophlyctis helioformis]